MGSPSNQLISADKRLVELTFTSDFQRGKIYTVNVLNVKDLSGNMLENTQKQIGIVEPVGYGDLVINEILFEPTVDVPEYFEIYNNSSKVLDLSKIAYGISNEIQPFYPRQFFLPKLFPAVSVFGANHQCGYHSNRLSRPDTANIPISNEI